jgi:hypothetical protein
MTADVTLKSNCAPIIDYNDQEQNPIAADSNSLKVVDRVFIMLKKTTLKPRRMKSGGDSCMKSARNKLPYESQQGKSKGKKCAT